MKFKKLEHDLSKEKFVIDSTGVYWVNMKEVSDTENLPKTNLPIRIVHDGMPKNTNLWLNYLKKNLFLDNENAEEILKIFKNEKSVFSLKRIILDSYGINFVFKNKNTEKHKEYVLGFIDSDSDPLTFMTKIKEQEIMLFRSKNSLELIAGKRMMRFNNDHSVEILT